MCQQHTKHLYVLSSQQLYQAVTVMNMPIIQMRKPRHSEWLFQGWGCATWLQSWCLLPPRPAAGMGRWPKAHSMTYPSATSVYIFTLHRKMKLECECIERRGGREIEQICSLTIKSYFNPVKDKKNQRNQRTIPKPSCQKVWGPLFCSPSVVLGMSNRSSVSPVFVDSWPTGWLLFFVLF